MPVFENIKNVDKEFHPYNLLHFMSRKEANHINSFKKKKEDYVPEDRIVSDEEYEIIRKLEKEAYEGDIDNRFKFNMWIHSTRRDLIGQPLEVIVEEMKKVDYKTLTRGWD
ncbi:MAG: hypothetical protein IKA22_09860 [Lentisphaeria bacterium]|nr:hypothetical protein [Lentisphaeria bacterium]